MSYYDFFDHANEDDVLPLFAKQPEPVSVVNELCVIDSEPFDTDCESYSAKLEDIIQTLKSRNLTCVEVEARWHRGQAAIGALRSMGHIIDTRRGVYVYVGFNSDMVKAKSFQQRYYETSHWKSKAAERKAFDNFTCVQCHSKQNLETHHWKYDLFNEDLRDLCTLCGDCHKAIHEAIKGSSVHFPRCITKEVAQRIEENQ